MTLSVARLALGLLALLAAAILYALSRLGGLSRRETSTALFYLLLDLDSRRTGREW